MARPTTLRGSKFLIQVGNGATPTEVFTAPCALTAKSININSSVNEVNVPDCDDPDAAQWVEREITAHSATISGSGTLAGESLALWRDWKLSTDKKNARVFLDDDTYGGYYQGRWVLTTLNNGANVGELATIEIEMQSDGEVTWTDA